MLKLGLNCGHSLWVELAGSSLVTCRPVRLEGGTWLPVLLPPRTWKAGADVPSSESLVASWLDYIRRNVYNSAVDMDTVCFTKTLQPYNLTNPHGIRGRDVAPSSSSSPDVEGWRRRAFLGVPGSFLTDYIRRNAYNSAVDMDTVCFTKTLQRYNLTNPHGVTTQNRRIHQRSNFKSHIVPLLLDATKPL
jgi:hypothetical protein